jgi:hypothetical protein
LLSGWLLCNIFSLFLNFIFAVVPELLEESHPKQSFLQLVFVVAGIAATAGVSLIVD